MTTKQKMIFLTIIVGIVLIAALIPVTIPFHGQDCNFLGCVETTRYTTRPVWLWFYGGGW